MENRKIIKLLFYVLLIGSGLLLMRLFWGYLTPIILAVVLVSMFYGFHKRVLKKLKDRKAQAAMLSTLLVVVVILVPIILILGVLTKEAFELYIAFQEDLGVDSITQYYSGNGDLVQTINEQASMLGIQGLNLDTIRQLLSQAGEGVGGYLYEQGTALASNIFATVTGFFILVFVMYYLFKDGKKILRSLIRLSPLPDDQERLVLDEFRKVSIAVFYGNGVTGLLQGVIGGIGFWIFGLGSSVFWGFLMLIFSFIPFLGPAFVYVPATIYLALQGNIWLALGFLAYNVIITSSVDNIVKPRLIGDKVHAHPLLTFLSIIGGIQVFGLLGVLYGPIIMTVFLAFLKIYERSYLIECREEKECMK